MEDYWKKTEELFKSLIEKPKMSEKLLKKPPPKYIYDIVMNTMKITKFPNGLFTDEELDPKFFEADPRNKIEILQKVIDITKIVTNQNFEIKPTNILKGEEPDKTNFFLQMFHTAATNGKDNSKLIAKYLDHKRKKAEDKKKAEEPKKQEEQPKQKADPAKPQTQPQPQQPQQSQQQQQQAKNEPKAQPKKIEQQPQEAQKKAAPPKNLISDKKKEEEEAKYANDTGNDGGSQIKMVSGTGMKLNKKIFVHDDIMNKENKASKPAVSNVDLETIKNYVQEITKNANPIGKIIEFIGDDIDLMNRELQNWIKESKSYKERYDEEIKKSEETLAPLQNELLELEESIKDEQMQIKSIKSRLIKNETIIQNLITNVISFKNEGS